MQKGLALSNSDDIRSVHNSFARQSVFEFDAKFAKEDDDVFHFVAYVPIKGRIYELDGLREGPLDHGAIPEGQDWISAVKPIIEARISKYQAGEIHFNLMAVIQVKLAVLQQGVLEKNFPYQRAITQTVKIFLTTVWKLRKFSLTHAPSNESFDFGPYEKSHKTA